MIRIHSKEGWSWPELKLVIKPTDVPDDAPENVKKQAGKNEFSELTKAQRDVLHALAEAGHIQIEEDDSKPTPASASPKKPNETHPDVARRTGPTG